MAPHAQPCPRCGSPNPPQRLFCNQCGIKLSSPRQDGSSSPALPRAHPSSPYEPLLDAPPEPRPQRRPRRRPRRKSSPLSWLAVLLCLVVLAGVGVFVGQTWLHRRAATLAPPALVEVSGPAETRTATRAEMQQAASNSIAQTATHFAAGADATPLPPVTSADRAAARHSTATSVALRDTAIVADARTIVAGNSSTTTAIAGDSTAVIAAAETAIARSTAAIVSPVSLFTLPIYPGARLADAGDPFVQGLLNGLANQGSTPPGQLDNSVYGLPPGTAGQSVLNYYRSALAVSDWQDVALNSLGAPMALTGSAQQYVAVWQRPQQQFIVLVVTGLAPGDVTQESGYLVLLLATENP